MLRKKMVMVIDKPGIAGAPWEARLPLMALFSSAAAALAATAALEPAVIVCHGLRGSRGVATVRKIRRFTEAQIVVFARPWSRDDAMQFVEAGADYCAPAPVSEEEGIRVVLWALTSQRLAKVPPRPRYH